MNMRPSFSTSFVPCFDTIEYDRFMSARAKHADYLNMARISIWKAQLAETRYEKTIHKLAAEAAIKRAKRQRKYGVDFCLKCR